MSKSNVYLERYASSSIGFIDQIIGEPQIIVVIPAHRESNISKALKSLHSCNRPVAEVAIIIVVNEAEEAEPATSEENRFSLGQIENIQTNYQQHVTYQKLPVKKAGVGLARKMGMDEAARFFYRKSINGIIVCYDADCICEPNYLQAIENYYQYPARNIGLVHYEHQLNGEHHEAIVNYELYLRYYTNALRFSKYPFSIQTLGSCITVKSSAYQKQGGMNTRKAGEDFYFLHKMTPLGGIGEINETTIYPSDRVSDRVPFGTGHAIGKYLGNPDSSYPVYDPKIFQDFAYVNLKLESWFENGLDQINQAPESLKAFIKNQNFESQLEAITKQSGDFENFKSRYYQWWDGFKVLKYVHFARDHFYKNLPLSVALNWLDQQLPVTLENSLEENLITLRAYDKSNFYYIK